MSRFRLYCGLIREGKWFNYSEVNPLTGGVLALLDSVDKSGAARLLNLVKGSTCSYFTEDDEEYKLKPEDYSHIYVADSWKIGYEQIKLTTGEDFPIIPENFYCSRCSLPNMERFTEVGESWQKLIDDGLIDEIFLNNMDTTFDVELPDPIVIPAGRTIGGGTFTSITRRQLTLGDMQKVHKDPAAMSSEAAMIYSLWDASIVKISGMAEREFNILKRTPGESFSKKYIAGSQKNYDAMEDADIKNAVGIIAADRRVTCKFCGEEIGGYIDSTNFFSPLLPKKSLRSHSRSTRR
jgi:hypothetical protein